MKNNVKENQRLIICDCPKNYSFVLCDAVQKFHWNDAQATLYPFEVYYKNREKSEHVSFL